MFIKIQSLLILCFLYLATSSQNMLRFLKVLQINNMGQTIDDYDNLIFKLSSTQTSHRVICGRGGEHSTVRPPGYQFTNAHMHKFDGLVIPIQGDEQWIFVGLSINQQAWYKPTTGSYAKLEITNETKVGYYESYLNASVYEKAQNITIKFMGAEIVYEKEGQLKQTGYHVIYELYQVPQQCSDNLRSYTPYEISYDHEQCYSCENLYGIMRLYGVLMIIMMMIEQ